MMPKSGLLENISVHSSIRSNILDLTCWCVFCSSQHWKKRKKKKKEPIIYFSRQHTRSLAKRSSASVKDLLASSRCIFGPQFWARAFPSLHPTISKRTCPSNRTCRRKRTSSVYSCTFALRCASRLIKAATASLALARQ